MGSAQTGGITSEEGALNVHPQEAIIPLSKLYHLFHTLTEEQSKTHKERRQLRRDESSRWGDSDVVSRQAQASATAFNSAIEILMENK